MNREGGAISAFPFAMVAATIIALGFFAAWPGLWTIALLLFLVYLAGPIAFRIHSMFAPLREGVSRLDAPGYSPWWGARQIQAFYDALPFLEGVLRLMPGWYSMWLRLWGSRIGFSVHWGGRIDVIDRSMLDIGNRVIFDRNVELCAHVMRVRPGPGGDEVKLLVRKITIGKNCFIGESARLGPGARVLPGERVPARASIGVNETFNGAALQSSPEEADMARD
ncbi:MAG: hypothetical protein GC206_13935 [Alphaproteobacteria bacterium]|nr:hypothetical protein [Alphaproteobacteria bacterium]